MAKESQYLNAGEFSSQTGIPVSTVTKFIREGKIKAEKKNGRWMIPPSQLKLKVVQNASKGRRPSSEKKPGPKAPKKASASAPKTSPQDPTTAQSAQSVEKTYSISEFAEMTYLTENGVAQWLRKGLLKGQQAENGDWRIDAQNLQVPNVKRLVREKYLK